jgi:1-acyl-sn-glycerol-3-phosphate acyltransferase
MHFGHRVTRWMRLAYWLSLQLGRFTWVCTMRAHVIRPEAANRAGGYILACTHLSHLEPFLAGILSRRPIDWMARIEFFRLRPIAWYLRSIGAFHVNRQGVPVSAIRTAIARATHGRVVGICPEGGVAVGVDSVCRGGAIKKGVCLVAHRAGVPVLPCVILGAYDLNRVGPWLPFKRARIWVAYGEPIFSDMTEPDRRVVRKQIADELQRQYIELYAELRETYNIGDRDVP